MNRHHQSSTALTLQSTLPRTWERETSFHDALYDWMSRAPWLALSAFAHVVVVLILMAIPWDEFQTKPPREFVAEIEAPLDVPFEDPLPEEPEDIVEEMPEEPELQSANEPEHSEDNTDSPFESIVGDPEFSAEAPFDAMQFNGEIGIGGGAGGKFGGRFGGKRDLRGGGGIGTERTVRDGLEWLRWHQSEDGSWDCDGFMSNCGHIATGEQCSDPGQALHDVGMTGLALLAFLGDGNTTREGPYKEQVAKGIQWLKQQQDPDLGTFGERVGHSFIYNHTIATLAVSEAYYFSKSPTIKRTAQDAVNFLTMARSQYGVWRYDYPPTGDGDTSITGWAVFALKSAEEAGLQSDADALQASRTFFDEMTDSTTGRCGYDIASGPGSRSSRVPHVNDHFPPEQGEAMSAVSLLCRVFLGDKLESDLMSKQADLLKKKLPVWNAEKGTIDFYYWYYGSYAMYQMGGEHWNVWNKALKDALVTHQRKDGDEKGSWDAKVDAWGHAGGRVYTTALGVLCLEVYFRYAKVLGAR